MNPKSRRLKKFQKFPNYLKILIFLWSIQNGLPWVYMVLGLQFGPYFCPASKRDLKMGVFSISRGIGTQIIIFKKTLFFKIC
jgi:hypothetical protein